MSVGAEQHPDRMTDQGAVSVYQSLIDVEDGTQSETEPPLPVPQQVGFSVDLNSDFSSRIFTGVL